MKAAVHSSHILPQSSKQDDKILSRIEEEMIYRAGGTLIQSEREDAATYASSILTDKFEF